MVSILRNEKTVWSNMKRGSRGRHVKEDLIVEGGDKTPLGLSAHNRRILFRVTPILKPDQEFLAHKRWRIV